MGAWVRLARWPGAGCLGLGTGERKCQQVPAGGTRALTGGPGTWPRTVNARPSRPMAPLPPRGPRCSSPGSVLVLRVHGRGEGGGPVLSSARGPGLRSPKNNSAPCPTERAILSGLCGDKASPWHGGLRGQTAPCLGWAKGVGAPSPSAQSGPRAGAPPSEWPRLCALHSQAAPPTSTLPPGCSCSPPEWVTLSPLCPGVWGSHRGTALLAVALACQGDCDPGL